MKSISVTCLIVFAAALPVEHLTELAQIGASYNQNSSMQTLLPGQVEEAVAKMNEHTEIGEAEEYTPSMEEYEHLNQQEQSSTVIEP